MITDPIHHAPSPAHWHTLEHEINSRNLLLMHLRASTLAAQAHRNGLTYVAARWTDFANTAIDRLHHA